MGALLACIYVYRVLYAHLVSSCIDLNFSPNSSTKADEESNFFPWTFVLLLGWLVCFETVLTYSSGWVQTHLESKLASNQLESLL